MTNLTVQYIIVAVIIAIALFYFVKSMRSSFAGKKTCGKSCSCGTESQKMIKSEK